MAIFFVFRNIRRNVSKRWQMGQRKRPLLEDLPLGPLHDPATVQIGYAGDPAKAREGFAHGNAPHVA